MDSGPLVPANGQALREVQSSYALDLNRPPNLYPAPSTQDSILREYLRVLIKRKWVVVFSLALIFALVAIATLRSTRIYEASGSIAINKADPTLVNFRNDGNATADFYDPSDLDTEVSILRSD